MTKDAGYWQAIDNLAYYIRQLSEETQRPHLEGAPFMWDASHEEQIEYCRQRMTPEQNQQWDSLDEIFTTIITTYGTSYDETFAEVNARIWQYELESGAFLN